MEFRVVVPARLDSTRLPRKVLREIHGRPLVQYVWQAAQRSGASEVVIATDSEQVRSVCDRFGADAEMTSDRHGSGTDRVNEVAQLRGWPDDGVVVNLQGDEPLMPSGLISETARLLADDAVADMATLAHPITNRDEWLNANVVKVVVDDAGHALYFSRAPIPWLREPTGLALPDRALRHIGIYAYRVAALKRFSALPPAALEEIEKLEQLRALANGMTIRVGITDTEAPVGVDTEADLRVVAAKLKP